MNELIQRVQEQLDNNYPVEKQDIQELINFASLWMKIKKYLPYTTNYVKNKLDIKPPINKDES